MCFLCLQTFSDHVDLRIRRHGDIDHLDLAAGQHLLIGVVRRQPMPLGHALRHAPASATRSPRG